MKIVQIQDSLEKAQICEKVLRRLPNWFGIESAIIDYIKDVQKMETWAAMDSEVVGFVSLYKHNAKSAELHVMGVLPPFHGKRIGSALLEAAEESLLSQGFQFLTVKTLGETRSDVYYDKTRGFYLKSGFVPVEEFKNLWGPGNPCLLMIKNLKPKYYAVIFSSIRNDQDVDGYEKAAQRMIDLAQAQNGFIKAESARDLEGVGITVSYWKSLENIKSWKLNAEHLLVQKQGRLKWYDSFTTRICQVEREYSFSKAEIQKKI